MSEENVKAEDQAVEKASVVRQMMDQWKDGKLTDAQDTFNSIMNDRADATVADRKAEVAGAMFNNAGPVVDVPEPTAGEVDVNPEPEVQEEEEQNEDA